MSETIDREDRAKDRSRQAPKQPSQRPENDGTVVDPVVGKGKHSKSRKQGPQAPESIAKGRLDKLTDVARYAPTKKGHFLKAYSGKSRKAAITAMCIDCSGFYQEEVRRCTVVACPLWEYRPYR